MVAKFDAIVRSAGNESLKITVPRSTALKHNIVEGQLVSITLKAEDE